MTSKFCSIILLILIRVVAERPGIAVKAVIIREIVKKDIFKVY